MALTVRQRLHTSRRTHTRKRIFEYGVSHECEHWHDFASGTARARLRFTAPACTRSYVVTRTVSVREYWRARLHVYSGKSGWRPGHQCLMLHAWERQGVSNAASENRCQSHRERTMPKSPCLDLWTLA